MSLSLINQASAVHRAHDADYLRKECRRLGFDVAWYPNANRICMKPGATPSEAFLLLPKSSLDTVNATALQSIGLDDASGASTLAGWVFVDELAVIGTEDADDPKAIFLARFCDRRYLFDRAAPPRPAYNLVSPFVNEPETYDSTVVAEFPYNPDTLTVDEMDDPTPWTWETLLEDLWTTFPGAPSFPTVVGSFPEQVPLDIRTEGKSSLQVFVDVLHSIGYEIYPTVAGGFIIESIGSHYFSPSALPSSGMLDDNHPIFGNAPQYPAQFRIGFQVRNRKLSYKHKNKFHFVTVLTSDVFTALSVVSPPSTITGATETIINGGATAVFKAATTVGDPENQTDLEALALFMLVQLMGARLADSVDVRYGRYVVLLPSPEATHVTFSIGNDTGTDGQVSTTFRTVEPNLNASLPEIDDGGESGPPLKAFQLTVNKLLSDPTAFVKWLDHDGNMVGDELEIYDREGRFSGRIANELYSGSPAFRGYALECQDLALEEPNDPRFEIVEMDALSEFIKAGIYRVDDEGTPVTVARFVEAINVFGYDDKLPAAVAQEVGYLSDTNIFDVTEHLANPVTEEVEETGPKYVLMQLVNADSEPPEYRVYEYKVTDSTATAPLRMFHLTEKKAQADPTAFIEWLDHTGAVFGLETIVYDPEFRFSGRAADGLFSGSPAFRGYAIQRADLAEVTPERWEIVYMDSLSEFIKAGIYRVDIEGVATPIARYISRINITEYDRFPPNAENSEVGYEVDADIFSITDHLADPIVEEVEETGPKIVLMQLSDPDSEPPTYRVYEYKASENENGAPLREFVLTANKPMADTTATVKWTSHAGAAVGSDVTVYDPRQRFSGRVADNLYSGSPSAKGYALLRTDLAEAGPDRWEMVEMDGLEEFVRAELYKVFDDPDVLHVARYKSRVNNKGYDRLAPAAVDSEIGYVEDTGIFNLNDSLDNPESGETGPVAVLMQLVDPDANPPSYRVYEAPGGGEKRRLIRGLAVGAYDTADSTILIDNVVPLANGLDPTNGDTEVAVAVFNLWGDSYSDNERVVAIHNGTNWEAMRKGGSGGGGVRIVAVESLISGAGNPESYDITQNSVELKEVIWNGTIWDYTGGLLVCQNVRPDPIEPPAGRWLPAIVQPSYVDPTKWVIVDWKCFTFAIPE